MADIFKARYGSWAVVTGTTGGIGKAFAEQLAAKGFNLVLVARRKEILDEQAKELADKHKIETQAIQADLADPKAVEQIIQASEGLQVGLFIPNAGVENHGEFNKNTLESESKLLQINVTSVMQLAHHFSQKMVAQGRGGILLLSSLGAYGIGPYMANYIASKAYVLTFGESLHYELQDKGVDVTVLSPGPTETPMLANAGLDVEQMGMKAMPAEEVARIGLEALGKKPSVISGTSNKVMTFIMTRIMPKKLGNAMAKKMMQKMFASE
ncbi:MAG: SDR family oxidoreductase [Spirochaetota bacterium]